MAAAGCRLHADLTALAVMWFARAMWNLPKFWGLVSRADRYFRHHRPDAVVLIDYPGLQLVDCAAGEGARHPGLLLHAAADLGLGAVAGEEDAAAGGPRAVQSALRGGVAAGARLPGDAGGPSVLRRGGAAAAGRGVPGPAAGQAGAAGADPAGVADPGGRRTTCRGSSRRPPGSARRCPRRGWPWGRSGEDQAEMVRRAHRRRFRPTRRLPRRRFMSARRRN